MTMFIIIEIILIVFNYKNKYEISKILEIDNINDFSIQKLKEVSGYDSSKTIFIKFKISVDKYEKYNLKYEDVNSNSVYTKEKLTNKKKKISNKSLYVLL